MTNRDRIETLLKKGKTLFYSDIASELGIDLEETVSICRELQEEGKIEVDKDYREVE